MARHAKRVQIASVPCDGLPVVGRAVALRMRAMNELLTMLPWFAGLVAVAAAVTQLR